MGLVLPQFVDVGLVSQTIKYYRDKGYDIPTYKNKNREMVVKRGTKIKVHALDLSNCSQVKVKVQCDKCGKIYALPYRDCINNYCYNKIGKMFCFECVNPSMKEYKINTEKVWTNKEYALIRLEKYISKYKTLKGWTLTREGSAINNRLKTYGYSIQKLCEELGYNYLELKQQKYPDDYFANYYNLKNELLEFIKKYGYFPTLKVMEHELGIPDSIIQKFGGSTQIKKDISYTKNEYIDDNGFYNRSHYEYMVAQFLIHNNITYKREQHPFPKPYYNLRSDFTFVKKDGTEIHLEVWGYLKEDADGSRSKVYCERKENKIKLYSMYSVPFIEIEPTTFSNSFDKIQESLSKILSDIFKAELKTIPHQYMTSPIKITDDELFLKIIKLSTDGITLPKERDYSNDNKYLFYEALKRFGNYNRFAKHFGVVTNSKRGYWNKFTVLNRMIEIHNKYGYMPIPSYLKSHQTKDSLFCGLLDGIKKNYNSTVDAYTLLFDDRAKTNMKLGESDITYLQNIVNRRYFHSSLLTEDIIKRANNILKVVGFIAA